MKHDYIGIGLLKIAAFLYATRYVVEALYTLALNTGNKGGYATIYYNVSGLTIAAWISGILGAAMLIIAALKRKY